MSDAIKTRNAVLRLCAYWNPYNTTKKNTAPLSMASIKMYLMMEKQHNRGQDGAGIASIKLDMKPGQRYISRIRSNDAQPIQDIF